MLKHGYKIRPLEEADLPMVLRWRNEPWVRQNMYTDHMISFKEHTKWFASLQNKSDYISLICEYKDLPIGFISFSQIDFKNSKAYWGFYLGEQNNPPGRGAAMEFLAIEYAFKIINLRKLCCEVFSFNSRVIKLHYRFGFQQEGLFRQHIFKNGNFEDVVSMALFSIVWEHIRNQMEKICFRITS
jgi:UDP-4-amino-4,6-dideoxy-N-acetyl-beta-L-altrosamine N-acetyltransferase